MSQDTKKPADDAAWRRFPQMDTLAEPDQMQATMRKIEQTCRQLDGVIKSGTEEQQRRAKAAMLAYGRTLDLIRELEQVAAKQAVG